MSDSTWRASDLALETGVQLRARGWLLASAESCTGGMIGAAITDIAGSSAWFDRGFITYSNEAKIELLGVSAELIATAGAVSEVVAHAMAAGALAHSRANASVSVTGIAGPGGATAGKPVGMICFGWAFRDGPVTTETRYFDGDRAAIRAETVRHSLQGLIDRLRRV